MRLPSTNIRRIFTYAIVGGLALGLLIVGFVRAIDLNIGFSTEGAICIGLLIGGLLGLSFIVVIKLALHRMAYSLYHDTVELSDSTLPAPPANLWGDEIVYMRTTVATAMEHIPRPGRYPEIAHNLVKAQDLQSALGVAALSIAEHLTIQGALLFLLDGERSLLYPACNWGQAQLPNDVTLDLHETAIGRALSEQRTAFYRGGQVRDLLPLLVGPEAITLFCLPLLTQNQPFGMLCLTSVGADIRFNEDQRSYAQSIAAMLTLAIESNIHRKLFNRESDRVSAFEQLGTLINSSERFEVALEQVLRVAARVTDSIHGSLLLLEPDESRVRYRITLKEGDVLPLSVTAGAILKHGLAGWALRERRADIVEDTERDTRWLPVPGLGEMRSVLIVPLLYGERALGILTLADPIPRHYSLRSLALASALAAYAINILARMQYDAMVEHGNIALTRRIFEGRISNADLQTLLVDPSLIEHALAAQSCCVVVLFLGLRGLEPIIDTLSTEQVLNQVLAPYVNEISTIIYEHHGYVSHHEDGQILAIFGFPNLHNDSRTAALKAALAIQVVTRRLRSRWRTQIGHDLTISAGLAPGRLNAGLIGEEQQQSHVLLGSVIHEARRLQQLARVDEVLVSATIVNDLGRETIFQFEELAPFRASNDESTQAIYRLTIRHG